MQHQYKVDSGCSGAAAALQPHPCTITIPPPEPTLTLLEEVPPHIQQKKQDHRKLILPFVFFLEKVLGALWYHHLVLHWVIGQLSSSLIWDLICLLSPMTAPIPPSSPLSESKLVIWPWQQWTIRFIKFYTYTNLNQQSVFGSTLAKMRSMHKHNQDNPMVQRGFLYTRAHIHQVPQISFFVRPCIHMLLKKIMTNLLQWATDSNGLKKERKDRG